MKKLCFVLTLTLVSYSAFAAGICQKLTSINQELDSSFWKDTQVTTLVEIPKTSPTHEFLDYDIVKEMAEGKRCEKGMIKTIFTVKSIPGQVFQAIISNEDFCDGGNAYGLIKSVNTDKVIATVEDSYINCLN